MTGIDGLLEHSSPAVRSVFLAAADVVRHIMPDANEQLDLPDRLLAFGFGSTGGTRLKGLAVALIPHSAHVNVQLADGAELADAAGLIEGTGKRIRHVKCRTVEDVARPALHVILTEQAAIGRGAAVLTC
jgi:hypothetical protein